MLDLELLREDYAVCRLPVGSPLPHGLLALAGEGNVVSVTWTPDEVSILCPAARVPDSATVETPWRCLRVAGPVDLALTGILASIVSPLADARRGRAVRARRRRPVGGRRSGRRGDRPAPAPGAERNRLSRVDGGRVRRPAEHRSGGRGAPARPGRAARRRDAEGHHRPAVRR